MNNYSVNQFVTIQNEIFQKMQSHEQRLIAIQQSTASLFERWQNLLQVILPIQLEVIQTHQIGDDQSGLSRFNEEYTKMAASSAVLLDLNKKKWLFIFEKAFNITEFKEIFLEEAQRLIADIGEAMNSEAFLKKIDNITNTFHQNSSLLERRQAILKVLLPLHMSVMAKHGFEGEIGYIQAQRAIMDYYYDPQIARDAAHAQSILFHRAKLV